jgi:hypothetical protein
VRFLGVLVLALAAASAAGAAPRMPNPCALVADWQVRAAIGAPVRHREPAYTNGVRACEWQPASYSYEYRSVTLTVQPLDRAVFTAKWNRPIKGVRAVKGIGEMAYSIEGRSLVAWRKGIEVTVMAEEIPSSGPLVERVAKLAFAHM